MDLHHLWDTYCIFRKARVVETLRGPPADDTWLCLVVDCCICRDSRQCLCTDTVKDTGDEFDDGEPDDDLTTTPLLLLCWG